MDFKPNLVPKNKSKVNYKIVVPFVIVAAFLFYYALQRFLPEQKVDQGYTICNLSGKESARLISKQEYPQSIVMSDYGQYGESLALYHEDFSFGTSDLFSGKTIFLNNVCHGDERAYMMDVELDRKLSYGDLEDGFYELELLDGLDRYFLMSEDVIEERFYSIARDGFIKKINLVANKDLFLKDGEAILDKHYVYLEVDTIKDSTDHYDLVIDPARFNELWDGFIDYGASRDGKTEADFTYEIAVALEKKLTDNGMKVKVLRDNETPKNFSGEGGRLEEAYNLGAKYYLSLAFPYSGSKNDYGSTVIYSSYASNSFATDIMKSLKENTTLKASQWSGSNDIEGVYPSGREEQFDRTQEIRESGGKLTGAGNVIDNPFGKDNPFGMESVYIELGFMSNQADYSAVHNNIDDIADALAIAILKNLGI